MKQRHLKLALLNTCSLNNKSLILNEFITDNNLDFLCIAETWHSPLDFFSLNQTTPTGYTYMDNPRPEGRGGGVAAFYRKDIKTSNISIPAARSFEHLTFKLAGPTPLVTAIIYCPPKPNPSFLSHFSDFLTHRGHILDLVCSTGLTIHHLSSFNFNISNYLAIIMDTDIPIPTAKDKRTISFRNLKSISPSALSASLASKISASPPPLTDNPSDLTKYSTTTKHSSCLNQLTPIKTKTVSFTHSAPWYTPELHKMKSRKRQLERLHKKTGLTVHLQAYTDYLQQYKDALSTARSTYYSHLIHSGSTNPKALFSTVNKLLKPSNNTFNSFTTDKCNSFLSFFQTKIDTIYNNLSSSPAPTACTPTPSPAPPLLTSQPLSQFSPMSPGELPKIMTGMKTSTCALDPIPSHIIKDSLPAISTLITEIINSSLRSG
ncbi:hypothetical protein D5F01_LYC02717 [Larimichthys crocea]|uniref:Endonuclease/exonuclease/phosphatase domain-containing protein n=1 Tax=Larimichthys crocea TaxID=215358 RepID=A0A6G0J379_LARCR|nr:hypothetical protein D5F01_LYC02717 [Larimichthys crocea]